MPFLRNVTRGRGVPDERLAVVARQYALFGGRSPLNDQCRELLAALRAELDTHGIDLPLYWGNRNWNPFLADTVAAMAADGVTEALVLATSAFGTYSGCRQYREDLERAAAAVNGDGSGPGAPRMSKLRLFYNHPGFIEAAADRLVAALSGEAPAAGDRLVFTAHSIPRSMAAGCSYAEQLSEAAGLVVEAAGWAGIPHDIVFQSRSGPAQVPWLGPDVNDHLRALAAAGGTDRVVLVPLGFLSDHMEVVFDLDTQARATAAELGLELVRVPTVGSHPRFVAGLRELIEERLHPAPAPPLAHGADGPGPDLSPPGHSPPPVRPA